MSVVETGGVNRNGEGYGEGYLLPRAPIFGTLIFMSFFGFLLATSAIASVAVDEGGLLQATSAIASVAIDEGEIVTHQEARPDGSTPEWRPAEFSEESVLVLSAANFTMARGHFPVMLVQFYAPWCSHSRALAPEFAAAADELQARGLEGGCKESGCSGVRRAPSWKRREHDSAGSPAEVGPCAAALR